MTQKNEYSVRKLNSEEHELAALVRQYRRATEAHDTLAQEVEAQAICSRITWLLYYHLDLRIGMSSEEWVWLNGGEVSSIEHCEPLNLRVFGRIWCSLPEEGFRLWSEPFAADIRHSQQEPDLVDYTLWFGSRSTILDLATVRELISNGENVSPRAPDHENGWAFVFRMGD